MSLGALSRSQGGAAARIVTIVAAGRPAGEGSQRKRHCEQGHDRQHRREGQAAGDLLQAHLAATTVRKQRDFARGLQPGESIEDGSEAEH
jgi:hypothetical protein